MAVLADRVDGLADRNGDKEFTFFSGERGFSWSGRGINSAECRDRSGRHAPAGSRQEGCPEVLEGRPLLPPAAAANPANAGPCGRVPVVFRWRAEPDREYVHPHPSLPSGKLFSRP